MPDEHARELPRWFRALGVVPVVAFAVAARTTDGDPVAALASAFGAQQVVGWLAGASLRRRGVPPRRAERLAERAAEPPWLVVPLCAALLWVAVSLVVRVRADPGDRWAWVFLVLGLLVVVAAAVGLACRGVRWLRTATRRRAVARAERRGARVA